MQEQLDYTNKSILITGGTGSLGRAITRLLLNSHPEIKRICIYSRDERKHALMLQEFPASLFPQVDYVIGDVRDKQRLYSVMNSIDYVIHTAAMKDVHTAESNPEECIKTNINGAQNIIEVCLNLNVKRVVSLSTDKACSPNSLYGATKLVSDKLFIAANAAIYNRPSKFCVVRYGNILGSSGSVAPFFLKKKRKDEVLPITNPDMTRFNISLEEGAKMVLFALEKAWGGEIFVPKLPSYRIMDLANAIGPDCTKEIVGIRPGEKLHEEMISESDAFNTYDLGSYYVIVPSDSKWNLKDFIKTFNAKKVTKNFSYNSKGNTEWETVESLKSCIKTL